MRLYCRCNRVISFELPCFFCSRGYLPLLAQDNDSDLFALDSLVWPHQAKVPSCTFLPLDPPGTTDLWCCGVRCSRRRSSRGTADSNHSCPGTSPRDTARRTSVHPRSSCTACSSWGPAENKNISTTKSPWQQKGNSNNDEDKVGLTKDSKQTQDAFAAPGQHLAHSWPLFWGRPFEGIVRVDAGCRVRVASSMALTEVNWQRVTHRRRGVAGAWRGPQE